MKYVFLIDVFVRIKKVVYFVDIESFDFVVDDIKILMKLFFCYYRKKNWVW